MGSEKLEEGQLLKCKQFWDDLQPQFHLITHHRRQTTIPRHLHLLALWIHARFPQRRSCNTNNTLELQLIQIVFEKLGSQEEVQKSEGRLKEMSKEVLSNEGKMLPASMAALNNVESFIVRIDAWFVFVGGIAMLYAGWEVGGELEDES